MDTEEIVTELEQERDRLDRVINLLKGDSKTTVSGRRRRYRTREQTRRISEGMRKHWIERRKKAAAGQMAEG